MIAVKHAYISASGGVDVVQRSVDLIQRSFNKRIVCLILYGSALSETDIPPNDYDLLLLLDSYSETDFETLRITKGELPLELFLDYKDQILRKGIENYQRGRHGTYFIDCLARGKCLIGENFYLSNLDKIPRGLMQKDLLFRIEEYFYRIQQHYVNDGLTKEDSIVMVKKYLSRICTDLLIYSGELSFDNLHQLHYSEIVTLASKSKLFSSYDKGILKKLLFDPKEVILISSTVQALYEIYLDCFEKWLKINKN